MFQSDDERRLQIRMVAWVSAPAGIKTGRSITITHYAPADANGQISGRVTRTLCGRLLPDEWDIAGERFEHRGWGDCRPCGDRFTRLAQRTPQKPA